MAQAQVQFTPVQVLQAARRAEAEGKMDYALQFYRHLVEQHGTTAEAQEAREGLFRIAEWRWGEARVARGREAAAGEQGQAAAPSQAVSGTPSATGGQQRVYNVAGNQSAGYYQDQQENAAHTGKMPQIIAREQSQRAGEARPRYEARFQAGKVTAYALSALGWLTVLVGLGGASAGVAGVFGELSALAMLGLPMGVLLGLPTALLGLALVVGGQLAAAVFEGTNATLELVALERGRVTA